jgi:hypothetical protein
MAKNIGLKHIMMLVAGPGSKDSVANGPKQVEGRSKMLWTIFAGLMILWIFVGVNPCNSRQSY